MRIINKIKKNVNNLKLEKNSLQFIYRFILFISCFLIVFSFLSPFLLTRESSIGFIQNDNSRIGDLIGGTMTPFIAIAGVLLTFLAFYVQYTANKTQTKKLEVEISKNLKKEYENRFFNLVEIYRNNIDKLELEVIDIINPTNKKIIKGRNVYKYLLDNIYIIFYSIKKENLNMFKNDVTFENHLCLDFTFNILFYGFEKNTYISLLNDHTYNNLNQLKTYIDNNNNNNIFSFIEKIMESCRIKTDFSLINVNLLKSNELVFRFQLSYFSYILQFIDSLDSELFSISDKRDLIKHLKINLNKQELLFILYAFKANLSDLEINKFIYYGLFDEITLSEIVLDFLTIDIIKKIQESRTMFEFKPNLFRF